MERSLPNTLFNVEEEPVLSSNLLLDNVGEVTLTHNSDGLSWKLTESFDDNNHNDSSACLGTKLLYEDSTEIRFSDMYAVEVTNYGVIHEPKLVIAGRHCIRHERYEMYRFTLHCVQSSKSQPSILVHVVYTFGHKDSLMCQIWANRIDTSLKMEAQRPRSLLVFVNPMSGKTNGCKTWEKVAPIFSLAKVKTKVTVTERAGHAFDVMTSISNEELSSYDGVITVGGDGFFNEILNGFLSSRYKCPLPPTPSDFAHSVENNESVIDPDSNERNAENEAHPLLTNPTQSGSNFSNLTDQGSDFPLPSEKFRFGIIPAGSTDAIVMCTTGAREPITSALHIVLGKRLHLDIAQVVRWRTTAQSKVEPLVRYAASFVGYGFYGDVITESEKYRWMGPKRYDFAGTKVFMNHKSYEAEISYIEVEQEKKSPTPERAGGLRALWGREKYERTICRVNCKVCARKPVSESTPNSCPAEKKWLRSKGRFLSVGAAIMSNRNEKAPDGLVADAHLSDGFLHLILVKDCPCAFYLWHLIQLTKKGGYPLNFEFVEYHKTSAFTFTSSGIESIWNLDGELFEAHELSAQVLQGFICLFASGPEV
ncbi:hypothetical protein ACFE04_027471 [Oxalis oulophora]